MRTLATLALVLAFLPGALFAQQGPKVDVKVTPAPQALPDVSVEVVEQVATPTHARVTILRRPRVRLIPVTVQLQPVLVRGLFGWRIKLVPVPVQ